jgi:hypothetical protein
MRFAIDRENAGRGQTRGRTMARILLPAWLKTVLAWVALAALGFVAARYYKHPLLYAWRGAETDRKSVV